MPDSQAAVLAIPITNHEAKDLPETMLAEVSFDAAGGMQITMTEGGQVYSTDLNKKAISSLVRNASSSWKDNFRTMMLTPGTDETKEIVAVAHSDHVTVILRERADVPLKLCSFEVPMSDTAEVSLYAWTVKAVQALEKERKDFVDMKQKSLQDEKALSGVKEKLLNFSKSSQAHEQELLSRFCSLLSAKKDKIRELQSKTGSQASRSNHKKARLSRPENGAQDDDGDDDGASSDSDEHELDTKDAEMHATDDSGDDGPNTVEAQSSAGSSAEVDQADETADEDEEL